MSSTELHTRAIFVLLDGLITAEVESPTSLPDFIPECVSKVFYIIGPIGSAMDALIEYVRVAYFSFFRIRVFSMRIYVYEVVTREFPKLTKVGYETLLNIVQTACLTQDLDKFLRNARSSIQSNVLLYYPPPTQSLWHITG